LKISTGSSQDLLTTGLCKEDFTIFHQDLHQYLDKISQRILDLDQDLPATAPLKRESPEIIIKGPAAGGPAKRILIQKPPKGEHRRAFIGRKFPMFSIFSNWVKEINVS